MIDAHAGDVIPYISKVVSGIMVVVPVQRVRYDFQLGVAYMKLTQDSRPHSHPD